MIVKITLNKGTQTFPQNLSKKYFIFELLLKYQNTVKSRKMTKPFILNVRFKQRQMEWYVILF